MEPGHYVRIDKSQALLDAGRQIELLRYRLIDKGATLVQMDDFRLETLDRHFDFAIAASVFTHLPLNDVIHCPISMKHVLRDDGVFFATFFENERGKFNLDPMLRP